MLLISIIFLFNIVNKLFLLVILNIPCGMKGIIFTLIFLIILIYKNREVNVYFISINNSQVFPMKELYLNFSEHKENFHLN